MISNETGNMVMPVAPMYGGNSGSGAFGNCMGGDWAWIILLLLLAGNGWGNNGSFGGGNNSVLPYMWNTATQNDVNRGFDSAAVAGQLSGIQNAIVNGFSSAEVANCNRTIDAMNQRFADAQAVTNGFANVSAQLAQCCCENRLAVANLGSDIAREACATRTADAQNTQSILGAINGGIQSIKDQLCQDKIDAKNDEIAQLRQEVLYARGQASQIEQNSNIINGVYNRLNECPVGTVPVYGEQPIFTCPTSNNSCGCGCGGF